MASNYHVFLSYQGDYKTEGATFKVWRHPHVIFPQGKFGPMKFSGKWSFFGEVQRHNNVVTTRTNPDFSNMLAWLVQNQTFFPKDELREFVAGHDSSIFLEPAPTCRLDKASNWVGLSYEEIVESPEAQRGREDGYAGLPERPPYLNEVRAWLWQSGYMHGISDKMSEESFHAYMERTDPTKSK